LFDAPNNPKAREHQRKRKEVRETFVLTSTSTLMHPERTKKERDLPIEAPPEEEEKRRASLDFVWCNQIERRERKREPREIN
jgi:hypothetical protein